MTKSPLSGAFSGSAEPEKKKNKKGGAVLLIAGVALASSIGGVFAATTSIAINDGADLEFGQGIAAVDVCAATADTTLNQTFDSAANSGAGEFYVSTVGLTIDAACNGKIATIALVVDDSGDISVVTADGVAIASGAASVDFAADNVVAGNVTDVTVTTAD